MNVELTERAQIALDRLQTPDVAGTQRTIAKLREFPNAQSLKGKVRKAHTVAGSIYIARASQRVRIVFREEHEKILILDIVYRDRLEQIFRLDGGGQ